MLAPGRRDADLTRLMGVCFGLGSTAFVIGPTAHYTRWVGSTADALTFFVGSILFTLGGLTQCLLAQSEKANGETGRATWRTAWIQAVGTVLFNVTTLAAVEVATSPSRRYDLIVWPPNGIGSLCFLVSGLVFYFSAPHQGLLPRAHHAGWWEPAVNLLGCVFFAISAVASLAVAPGGAELSLPVGNWTTSLGAVCFLLCALSACIPASTLKAPRLRQLRTLERELRSDVDRVAGRV